MGKSSCSMRDVSQVPLGVTCNTPKYSTFVQSCVTVTCILLPTGAWGPFAYLVDWGDSTVHTYSSELSFAATHAGGNVGRICVRKNSYPCCENEWTRCGTLFGNVM
jgi:hypothetical protein